jgi:phenylalanyl-tRNA synthetase beta chain
MAPFDVYRGEQVGEGRKSIAFRVEFRSPERTLTDEEAAVLREKIVAALGERFGAELRA